MSELYSHDDVCAMIDRIIKAQGELGLNALELYKACRVIADGCVTMMSKNAEDVEKLREAISQA